MLQEQTIMGATPHQMRTGAGDKQNPLSGRHALLVEDMPIMVKILGRALDRLGISYDHVGTGERAIEAVLNTQYDVVFMDIMMPGIGGVEATRRIRAHEAASRRNRGAVPIIAVTTKMASFEVAQYHDAGMTDCIKKPVDQVSLEVMLGKHLNGTDEPTFSVEEQYDVLSDEMEFVNWDTLNEYGTLFKSGMKNLIQDYLQAAPGLLEVMSGAVQDRNGDRIHMFASQLKSASSVFGAEKLAHLAARLEILAGKNRFDDVDTLFFDLHIAFEHTKNALKKKLVILNNL